MQSEDGRGAGIQAGSVIKNTMSIDITKHAEGYTAVVTPPDSTVEWSTERPMDLLSLQIALQGVGCPMIDVEDALANADPEIGKAQDEARFRVLSDRVGPDRAAQIIKETDEDMRRRVEATRIRREEGRRRQAEALRIRMEEYRRRQAEATRIRREEEEY